MFLRLFLCVLGFSSFFSTRALAVQAGEIFWEVKKPGTSQPPNYLIGTKHDMILNQESLPPELILALRDAKTGLFEMVIDDETDDKVSEFMRAMSKLPDGKTLSFYLGEENTQRIFEAIQFALNQLDDNFLAGIVNEYRRDFDLDIRSFKEFNQVTPSFLFSIIQRLEGRVNSQHDLERGEIQSPVPDIEDPPLSHLPRVENENEMIPDDENIGMDFTQKEPVEDIEECFLQAESMDIYFQEVLSCMGKSIHSLETMLSDLGVTNNHELMANYLNRDMDMKIKLFEGRMSETENAVYELRLFLEQMMMPLMQVIVSNYHQGVTIENDVIMLDVQQGISDFLRNNNQCSVFPQSSIDQFVFKTADFIDFFLEQLVSGKQIEEEKEREFVNLIGEMYHSRREIVSLCFPDYVSSDSEEAIRNEEKLPLAMLKTTIETDIISRNLERGCP